MTRKKSTIISLLAVFILSFVLSTTMQARGHRRGPGRRGHFRKGKVFFFMRLLKDPKVLKKTGISKSKARRIRTIIRNSIKKGVLLKARMKVLKINAWEQWDRTDVDQDKIISILKKKHALKWQLKLLRVKTRIKIRNMLTETQRRKLKEIGRRRARRFFRGRRGRRGPGGPGGPGGPRGPRGPRGGRGYGRGPR